MARRSPIYFDWRACQLPRIVRRQRVQRGLGARIGHIRLAHPRPFLADGAALAGDIHDPAGHSPSKQRKKGVGNRDDGKDVRLYSLLAA